MRLDLGDLCRHLRHALQHVEAELRMAHFAAAEAHGHLDLVAFLEEVEDLLHLHFEIMIVDVRTHLDLFDFLGLLRLAGRIGLFLGFVFILAHIQELAHRRIGVGGYFDQIEADFGRLFDRFSSQHYAQIFAFLVDHTDLGRGDEFIVSRAVLRRHWRQRAAGHGRAYSCISCVVSVHMRSGRANARAVHI